MPVVTLEMLPGASREQKAAVVKDITESLVSRLGKRPEHIHVIIREVAEENWGYRGLLTDDLKAGQGS